jgi:alginate O-acetyltransferase complex protein AlgI
LRRIGLIGLSLLFYLIFAGYAALVILVILTTLTHIASRASKFIVALAIVLNIASLFFWKFAVASPADEGSLLSTVIIPLGFSFFIFEFCHYLIEIWRGNLKPVGFFDFIGFVFSFRQ